MEGDLDAVRPRLLHDTARGEAHPAVETIQLRAMVDEAEFHFAKASRAAVGLHRRHQLRQIGRASCRKSVDLGGRRIIKKKKKKKKRSKEKDKRKSRVRCIVK